MNRFLPSTLAVLLFGSALTPWTDGIAAPRSVSASAKAKPTKENAAVAGGSTAPSTSIGTKSKANAKSSDVKIEYCNLIADFLVDQEGIEREEGEAKCYAAPPSAEQTCRDRFMRDRERLERKFWAREIQLREKIEQETGKKIVEPTLNVPGFCCDATPNRFSRVESRCRQ